MIIESAAARAALQGFPGAFPDDAPFAFCLVVPAARE